MFEVFERRTLSAVLILSLEDAFAREWLGPASQPRPYEPLRFWLVGRELGGVAETFDPVPLEVTRNASGYHLFFGRAQATGGAGQRPRPGGYSPGRLLDLPPGVYTLRITSPYYQTLEDRYELPMPNPNLPDTLENYSNVLQPGYAYPFPNPLSLGQVADVDCDGERFPARSGPTLLRGVVLDTNGAGMAGARVRVPGRPGVYLTDATGQWVLWFRESQPTAPVTVRIEPAGRPPVEVADVCLARGYETVLHNTALRGWVRQAGRELPGAVVTVTGKPGQALSGPDGAWRYVFPFSQGAGNVEVRAALPGGPTQRKNIAVVPRSTVVVDTFIFP